MDILMYLKLTQCLFTPRHLHFSPIRVHAADVLRNLHVMLTRGGLMQLMMGSTPLPAAAAEAGSTSGDTQGSAEENALTLLTLYLSAIVHDFDHRGVTNGFLIQDEDPLAVSVGECGASDASVE